jgi:hypothetical protein
MVVFGSSKKAVPKGWKEAKDSFGRAYWFNSKTGETSLARPDSERKDGLGAAHVALGVGERRAEAHQHADGLLLGRPVGAPSGRRRAVHGDERLGFRCAGSVVGSQGVREAKTGADPAPRDDGLRDTH